MEIVCMSPICIALAALYEIFYVDTGRLFRISGYLFLYGINLGGEDIYFMKHSTDHYVYVYLDPRKMGTFVYDDLIFDAEPFYVGSGRGYRKRYHLYENDTNHKNKPKYYKIKKIKSLELIPIIIEIYSNLSKENSLVLETQVMKKIGFKFQNTGPLLNFKTAEDDNIFTKKLYGHANPMFGRTVFDFWKEKYSESDATKMINEYKKNMSAAVSGEKNGMYGSCRTYKDNPNFGKGNIVLQFTKSGEFIQEWVNVPAAARHLSTSSVKSEKALIANIYKSIATGNSAWGYNWKYKKI